MHEYIILLYTNSAMLVLFWPIYGFFLSFEAFSVKNLVLARKKYIGIVFFCATHLPNAATTNLLPAMHHKTFNNSQLSNHRNSIDLLNTTHRHRHLIDHCLPLPLPVFIMSGMHQNLTQSIHWMLLLVGMWSREKLYKPSLFPIKSDLRFWKSQLKMLFTEKGKRTCWGNFCWLEICLFQIPVIIKMDTPISTSTWRNTHKRLVRHQQTEEWYIFYNHHEVGWSNEDFQLTSSGPKTTSECWK